MTPFITRQVFHLPMGIVPYTSQGEPPIDLTDDAEEWLADNLKGSATMIPTMNHDVIDLTSEPERELEPVPNRPRPGLSPGPMQFTPRQPVKGLSTPMEDTSQEDECDSIQESWSTSESGEEDGETSEDDVDDEEGNDSDDIADGSVSEEFWLHDLSDYDSGSGSESDSNSEFARRFTPHDVDEDSDDQSDLFSTDEERDYTKTFDQDTCKCTHLWLYLCPFVNFEML
jgi:hypothetical protein